MKARRLGYARVSTKEQVVDRQVNLLKEAGVSKDNIYIDKITGRTLNREKWKELLADLIVGDTLIVTELDRLGRNKRDILNTFELLKAKGVYIEILNMPLLNTNNENEFVKELLQPTALNLLAYFAEKEIELKKTKLCVIKIVQMKVVLLQVQTHLVLRARQLQGQLVRIRHQAQELSTKEIRKVIPKRIKEIKMHQIE